MTDFDITWHFSVEEVVIDSQFGHFTECDTLRLSKHDRGQSDVFSFIIALPYLRDRGIQDGFLHAITSETDD